MALNEENLSTNDRINRENVTVNVNADQSTEQTFKTYNLPEAIRNRFRVKNQHAREFLAELFGTFILIAFGCSSCAQNLFFSKEKPIFSTLLSINLSFGFAATLAGVVIGKISGGHINPAVSFAMLLTGRMTVIRFLIYSIAQFIGAFLGALFVYITYLDGIYKFQSELTIDTAGIFTTFPNEKLSIFGGFFDQFFATSLLIIVILALTDSKNSEINHGTTTIIVGLTITIIGSSFAYNAGYAINPMRDFGPRLFTLIIWGPIVFTHGNYFFWIPIVAPMFGSLFGVLAYYILVGNNWP